MGGDDRETKWSARGGCSSPLGPAEICFWLGMDERGGQIVIKEGGESKCCGGGYIGGAREEKLAALKREEWSDETGGLDSSHELAQSPWRKALVQLVAEGYPFGMLCNVAGWKSREHGRGKDPGTAPCLHAAYRASH